MNQTVFPPVLIGDPDLTPCELAAKQSSWGSKFKRFFKQAITYTVLASLQLGTLVQTKEAYAQYAPYGQPTNGQLSGQPNTGYVAPVAGAISGYTNDGTLFMGGQRIGNPHQILHDAQIPAFMTITATRYTFTNDPTHGQGTLAQMELATTNGSDSSVLLNRLYLSPTNPYVQGAPGPYPNYQTYQGVLQNAQQANYLLTNADDGKTYAFKTLTAASARAVDLLIRELPNTSQFQAAADPLGGGTGVRVTQNGDAAALAAYLETVKPYDYSWQPNFGTTFGQNGGQNPYGGWANSNNFAPDYSEGAGPAQSFQAFIKQLQDDAVANDKRVRSQTSANSLDLSGVNPNSLFGEGYNLFEYGSNSNPNRDLENDFLKRLQAGQLTAGSSDYLEASRIAQERYRIAYATRLETNKPLQYSVADAQRKANELKLGDINANELFGQGFDLFKYNPALRANGAAENDLLARLQSGQLQAGSSEYQQAAEIAQQRLREAYAQSLSPPPPKKVSKWKLIAGAVVGAVLTFVTAGAAAPFIGAALGVGSTVATAIAGVVAGAVGSIASTTITTGSLSQGLKAGAKALVSGGVKAIVAGALGVGFAAAGLSGLSGIEGTLSNIAMNTLSGAVTGTILGQGSFADNLKTSAISSVVDAVGKSVANDIGKAFPNGDGTNLANYAAHAVLGCASAAAKGGDCAAGAVGAVAGEAAAATGFLDAAAKSTIGRTLYKDEVVFFGGLVGGTTAAIASKAEDVNANFATGTATASNAVENNYLQSNQLRELTRDFNKCKAQPGGCSQTAIAKIEKEYADLSAKNDAALAACKTSECIQKHRAEIAKAKEYDDILDELDGRKSGELRDRQKREAALAQQEKVVVQLEQKQKEIQTYIATNCQGMSATACDAKLANSQEFAKTVVAIAAGFTPLGIALDIKDLIKDPSLISAVAVVAGPVADVYKGVKGVGGVVDGVGDTANIAKVDLTKSPLKNQLEAQNLANIAAADPRLNTVVTDVGKQLNYSAGSGTLADAERLGKIWVGDGAKLDSDGKGWLSADGTRYYRPPEAKSSSLATTGKQANFETFTINPTNGKRTKVGNAHLNITP